MTTLEQAKKLLEPNQIYCSSIIEIGLDGHKLVGLHIDESPILMNDKMALIRKIIGEGFSITPFTNEGWIKITKK